jgi:hypothetical protein
MCDLCCGVLLIHMMKLFKHISIICSHHDKGDLSTEDNVVQYTGFPTKVGKMGKMQNGTTQQEGSMACYMRYAVLVRLVVSVCCFPAHCC